MLPDGGVCDAVDMDCVKVSHYDGRAMLTANTNSSLRLQLLPWQPPSTCPDTSFPSVKYTVYYRPVNSVDTDILCDHPSAACTHKVYFLTYHYT